MTHGVFFYGLGQTKIRMNVLRLFGLLERVQHIIGLKNMHQ